MRRTRVHWVNAVVLVLLASPLAWAGVPTSAPAVDERRTGEFQVRFAQRSPESAAAKLAKRLGWPLRALKEKGMEIEYDLEKESFETYVPADYDGSRPYGLFVWISASPSGKVHKPWVEILDKRHLIWIGANNAGNARAVLPRLGLALDAVHNMKSKYSIDPQRIYVSGASGGGRCASIVGVCWPDVFSGGFYMIGCDYFRDLPTGEPNKFWVRSYLTPATALLTKAKRDSYHVLLTGETDMNRPQTKANYELGFQKDGFQHVAYVEVPAMGHQPPPADWFEKGLDFLDERPKHRAPQQARSAASQPVPHAGGVDPAQTDDEAAGRLLRMAKLYISNDQPDEAKAKLRQLTERYPSAQACQEAKRLLTELESR